ncbi:MAG: putative zinc-type alcohol dehydrogenase-like protein YjmD [Lentisphaerae bacterium ADurb.BinA184]|nr:MAG: putative zinc-type alcohol dehydrogenase-like protein YjmD [Lentisphaerae bacterium ADurb.BinA184]
MRAFCIVGPGQTELREVPPPSPGPEDVVMRVRLVGFCGSDLNTFRGRNPLVGYPRIPGHEIAGVIEGVGTAVPPEWGVGQAVTVSPYTACGACPSCRQGRSNCCRGNQTLGVQRDGAMAELITVPWRKLFTSEQLSLRQLAMVEPLTIGAHAVGRGRVRPDDTVAVFGCGAIGLGAVAAAAARGARVIAIDLDDAKLERARGAGAAAVLNSATADLHGGLQALTGGDGPAVVIEAVGLPATFRAAVDEVGFAGRVVYIGYAAKPVEYETKAFVQKELDILGSRNATPDDFRQVIAMLEGGRPDVSDLITRVVPLAAAGEALRAWEAAPGAVTKILVEVAG